MVRLVLKTNTIKKYLFVMILTIINLSTFLLYIPAYFDNAQEHYIYLSVDEKWFKLLSILVFAELVPTFLSLTFVKFLHKNKGTIIVLNAVMIVLSIIVFLCHLIVCMFSSGPFMSHTTDINNFGKYDHIVESKLQLDDIEKIINTDPKFTCVDYEYSFSDGMLAQADINYVLKFSDDESFEREHQRISKLITNTEDCTYSVKLNHNNSLFLNGDYAYISVKFDKTNNISKYNITVGW